jgi:dTDP-4-amino-4,6-dideoxygalactose transaminase
MTSIPFNRTSTAGREIEYIVQAVLSGQVCGDRDFSRKCQALLEKTLAVPRALVTTSCTHALEMAALLLEIGPGDEVIVPSFTFVSTANAFALRGATIVFADSRPDTMNLDETLLDGLLTPRTTAVVPVHYAGVGCEMDAILAAAAARGAAVVEDNAHGLFGKCRGRWLGTFGALATQSFHETKNITCGEGGALLINDPRLVERAEILREKGTDRSRFHRGEVDKYTWVDVGSSYVMSDVLAAFLYGQLEQWPAIQERRRGLWARYHAALRDWCASQGVRQPVVPPWCEQTCHMYYLFFPTAKTRQQAIAALRQRDILAVFHYVPLHASPMGRRCGRTPLPCPVAEAAGECLLRLPFYNSMDTAAQDRVIETLTALRL